MLRACHMENKIHICWFHIFPLNVLHKFKMPYKNHERYYLHEIMMSRFSEKKRRKEEDEKGKEHFRFDKF